MPIVFAYDARIAATLAIHSASSGPAQQHQNTSSSNTSRIGWGAQLSGTIRMGRPFRLFFNGVYGEGITPYIQDLTGSGLDFAPNPENPAQMQTMPM